MRSTVLVVVARLLLTGALFGACILAGCLDAPVAASREEIPTGVTRTVYSGYADTETYIVPVPDIDLNDMPLVMVYVRGTGTTLPPVYFEQLPISSSTRDLYALLLEDSVLLKNCEGLEYRLIVVK